MKALRRRLNWIRVVVAVILAEMLPILLLIAIVSVYSLIRQKESLSPKSSRRSPATGSDPSAASWRPCCLRGGPHAALEQRFMHGMAVGVGTALLDLGLGILLGGGRNSPIIVRLERRQNRRRHAGRLAGNA